MPTNAVKSIVIEIIGWLLVIVGIAALVLPGPGLLALFAGLTLLATRYEWAERRLQPVKSAAIRTARDSVSNWRSIALTSSGIVVLFALSVLWIVQPDVPQWWPIGDSYWLLGGEGTGITLLFSGVIASGMFIYSFIQFRKPSDTAK